MSMEKKRYKVLGNRLSDCVLIRFAITLQS